MREELPIGIRKNDVVLGLKRSDACFRQFRTGGELVLLLPEGVAAQRLERDRGQLATQAGYAGIHGASSLVSVTLWVAVVSWPRDTLFRSSNRGLLGRTSGV